MPLIVAAFLAHAAGLLLGFGGASFSGLSAAVIVLAAAALRRDVTLAGLAVIGGAGVLRAIGASSADAACVGRVEREAAIDSAGRAMLRVTLDAPARAGGRVRALVQEHDCHVRVTLLVERVSGGTAPAGAQVAARGRPLRVGRTLLIQDAVVAPVAPPSLARRMRERSGRAIDRTFAGDAALARALLIADTRTLDAGVRARYADAGIVHLLSVSGLHVAIIASAVELLLAAARLSRTAAAWTAVAFTAGYVVMIGAPAPAVRAAGMLGAAAIARLSQRPTSPWAVLALGAALPLADPRTVTDLGYQLSVVGLAALVASGALGRRLFAGRVKGWRRVIARDLLTSVLASVVTLPLIAWTFGRVSLVSPVANLAAGPVFTVLQPTLFLALLLAPVPAAASVVADAAHVMLGAVDLIAEGAVRVPGAAITVAPTLWNAVLLAIIASAAVVACSSRPESAAGSRALIGAAAAGAMLIWSADVRPRGGTVELHAIDVGQGDAVALRTPRGRWVLFDAGRSWSGGDAGRMAVIPYLRRRGGALEAFVLSHPHADHAGGAASIVDALRPREYWDAAYVAASHSYRESLRAAERRRVTWRRARPGDSLVVDGVHIRFLAPDSTWAAGLADANEASTVALVRFGRVRFLLVGDAERGEEQWLLDRDPEALRADVLKVGHHGSSTSSTPEFLDAVRPRVALISVGAGNTYGHPSSDVVRSLMARGAQVLRTDHLGSVVVSSDGLGVTVEAGGERWVR